MQEILSVTVPFFALVLAGWLAARARLLPLEAIPGLNAFVLYFALPCLLLRFGARLPVGELFDPVVLGLYLLCAAVVVAVTMALTRSADGRATATGARVGQKDAAFGALVAAFPNSGFMGVPLLVALAGPAAAGPTISSVLADLFFTSSLCIALAQWQPHAHDGSALAAAGRSLRAALGNPLPWSIGIGALMSATGQGLPGPLDKVVAMLADAATPVALFTIGAVLWRSGQAGPGPGDSVAARMPPSRYLPVALIKLALHPALVWLGGLAAQRLGLALSDFQLAVLVLVAALPSASNVSLLAERYGADNGRIARIILASTVLAFASFPLLAWWLQVQPG
ncbi:MAG: AEC family transporter [Burkholderiaceae bacterium]|nr:AEC family transporter [Burkholderiaceae bacterium]